MGSESVALASFQEALAPAPISRLTHDGLWIGTPILADLAGISNQASRKAALRGLNGLPWNGAILEVRNVDGAGGQGGKALQVFVPSLPPNLRDIWHKRYQVEKALDHPVAAVLPAPTTYHAEAGKRFDELRWKMEILAPALDHLPRSHGRGEALRMIASTPHTRPNGEPVKIAYSTLGEWLRKLATKGEASLPRKRVAKGVPRVIINRKWDAACPLPDEEKNRIRGELETYLKTEWSKGVPGVYRVQDFASSKLVELCHAAGWAAASLAGCDIGRYMAEQYRDWALVALKEKNAKKFFDTRLPRIKVNRKKLKPGDVVVGDVPPLDVAKAEDGRTVHARLICWLDLATYDIFVTVVILAEGRGIRQEDIARSFVDMVQAWGLPKQLRLDNGKEYKWEAMMEGFSTLAGLVRDFGLLFLPKIMALGEKAELLDGYTFDPRNIVSRARPYNAPAKQIESVFCTLEYFFFALMTGWIGGDRMNKRTHKVGEAPEAHQGTNQDFLRDIDICLDLYRNTVQADGSSPYDKRRAAYKDGLVIPRAPREVFLFAFADVRRFVVHTSGVNVDGQWGTCDALIPLIGQKVDIRVVKWDRSHTFYLDPNEKLHAIPMGREFDHDDPAGAKEQGRLTKVQNNHIKALKAETTSMDLMSEAERYLSHMPPAPLLPDGPTITTVESAAIIDALAAVKLPPPVKLLPGDRIHPNTGEIMKIASLPKEQRPNAETASGLRPVLPLPAPTQKEPPNLAPAKFDLLKNLQPVAKPM